MKMPLEVGDCQDCELILKYYTLAVGLVRPFLVKNVAQGEAVD